MLDPTTVGNFVVMQILALVSRSSNILLCVFVCLFVCVYDEFLRPDINSQTGKTLHQLLGQPPVSEFTFNQLISVFTKDNES